MSKFKKTFVTQPMLPPLEQFYPYLEQIWQSKVLSNGGQFHSELEKELEQFLGVRHISLFSNATIGLVVALKSLGLKGEVITTPFSFIATAHSLLWNNLTPVFVDIDEQTLNLDPSKIEAAITEKTSAILPVHCYGNPCDVDEIDRIAKKHNLRVLYDAAHAFGADCHCGKLLEHGDLSVLSFHATKVFNTFEGGAVISPDEETKLKIDLLKNFGHRGETEVVETGINGKMSEINAAFGLLQLKYIQEAIDRRGVIDSLYRSYLDDVHGIRCIYDNRETRRNYSYFPILVGPHYPISRDQLVEILKEKSIFPRRYFYPLIPEQPMYRHIPSGSRANLPIAYDAAERILCLPIYPDLEHDKAIEICEIIAEQ